MKVPDPLLANGNVEKKLAKVDRATSRMREFELILVIIAATAGVVASGFSAWSAWQIWSCTTPTGKCYKDNTIRARETTRNFLEDLKTQHGEIKCVLRIPPSDRTEKSIEECEAQHQPRRTGP